MSTRNKRGEVACFCSFSDVFYRTVKIYVPTHGLLVTSCTRRCIPQELSHPNLKLFEFRFVVSPLERIKLLQRAISEEEHELLTRKTELKIYHERIEKKRKMIFIDHDRILPVQASERLFLPAAVRQRLL